MWEYSVSALCSLEMRASGTGRWNPTEWSILDFDLWRHHKPLSPQLGPQNGTADVIHRDWTLRSYLALKGLNTLTQSTESQTAQCVIYSVYSYCLCRCLNDVLSWSPCHVCAESSSGHAPFYYLNSHTFPITWLLIPHTWHSTYLNYSLPKLPCRFSLDAHITYGLFPSRHKRQISTLRLSHKFIPRLPGRLVIV